MRIHLHYNGETLHVEILEPVGVIVLKPLASEDVPVTRRIDVDATTDLDKKEEILSSLAEKYFRLPSVRLKPKLFRKTSFTVEPLKT